MSRERAIEDLEAHFRRVSAISGSIGVLNWDRSTYMPDGGAQARAEQVATLSVMLHELVSDDRIGDWLELAETPDLGLDPWRSANLREIRREWQLARAVPSELVDAFERSSADCEMTWRAARAANDFGKVAPHLRTVIGHVRQVAAAKGRVLGLEIYDTLLDLHDPGLREQTITPLFARLSSALPPLLERILETQAREPAKLPLDGPFPSPKQRALAERLMRHAGFDFEHGRLDTSHHPFTGGVPDDVRITTRWDEEDFASGLMAVLHETGHALYELGLPGQWRTQPVGRACGMTLHESQSLLMEMQACRTSQFISFAAPLFRETFGTSGPAWEASNLERHYRRVERSLIRVDADEVTYPLHILLRHQLERDLVSGELEVVDLPEAWNQGMWDILQIRPDRDAEGCLQDIHWYTGAFGYFPTYTLGALAAAQLFAAAQRAHPEIPNQLADGDFRTLLSWLRKNVHDVGSRQAPHELIEAASGSPLGTACFEAHLEQRYLDPS